MCVCDVTIFNSWAKPHVWGSGTQGKMANVGGCIRNRMKDRYCLHIYEGGICLG